MPKNWGCHGNNKSVKLQLLYISHLHYVQLYETLHLEMAVHFEKVTETGPSLKQVLLQDIFGLLKFQIFFGGA